MAGIPVRIHPMFWLIAFLLGWVLPLGEQLVWVVVVLVSVLAHEMGHALLSRAFGRETHVVLFSMGGLTIPNSASVPLSGVRHAMIAFSGPLAGFSLALLVYLFLPVFGSTESGILGAFYFHLLWVNVAWGVINLLPVFPLDGGQIVRSLLLHFAGTRGYTAASLISLVTSVFIVIFAWQMNQPLLAIFFAYFALMEWQRSM